MKGGGPNHRHGHCSKKALVMLRLAIISAIAAIVVIALIVLCVVRWDAWFGNPGEAPYDAPATPARVMLTFGDSHPDSRNISWTCGTDVKPSCVSLIDTADTTRISIQATGETFASRSGKAAYYVARLRHLRQGHTYRYRVTTANRHSPWHTFRMPQTDRRTLSFIYSGDIQDTTGGIANSLLRQAFRSHPDAQLLICGGDLTERPTDAFWGETFCSLDSICQSLPVMTAAGNHEYLKGIKCEMERRFDLIHSYYLDSMEDDNHVFTLTLGPAQFFVLDSNRELPYLLQQADWLKKALSNSRAQWKIIVMHHPLYSLRGKYNNILQRWVFNPIIRKHGVDLVLQGHEHAYGRRLSRDAAGRATTPLYITSTCSPKFYRIKHRGYHDKAIADKRMLQKVSIAGDTLTTTAFDPLSGQIYDSLSIVKKRN